MTIAAYMQPYFFPYLGYFQLMSACDVFVVADDVQYIARGWVNRNRILVNGMPAWLTLPVTDADHRLPIHARYYLLDSRSARRLRGRIVGAYRRAPFFEQAIAVVDESLSYLDPNVAAYNTHLLSVVSRYLGITTRIVLASTLAPLAIVGEARVIERCHQVAASGYVNAIGGVALYRPRAFTTAGISLSFVKPFLPRYEQLLTEFIPALSIIDVMMFNDATSIAAMLRGYELIAAGDDARPAATAPVRDS